MTQPRLLLIGPVPPPMHGVTAYVRMLLDDPALRERWEVLHLDTSDHRSLANLGRFDLTNVRLALSHVAELALRLRRERVQAVWIPVSSNAAAYLRDALFILAAHAAGARVVTHLHGGGFGEFYQGASAPVRWLVRASSARIDRAWVLGNRLQAMYDGLVPRTRLRVVPNGVPDPMVERAAPAVGDRPCTLLHLGSLSVAKGVLELLEAARRIVASGSDLRVILAGGWLNGHDERLIRAALGSRELRDRVELPGVVTGSGKSEVLERADVFVLATRWPYEGQPLAILEAMAASLPVVATPRAAIPDSVQDGVTGILVPEGDTDALTAGLARLAADAGLRARMGAGGRALWAREFTAARAMSRVVEAFEEVRGAARDPVAA